MVSRSFIKKPQSQKSGRYSGKGTGIIHCPKKKQKGAGLKELIREDEASGTSTSRKPLSPLGLRRQREGNVESTESWRCGREVYG